MKRPMTLAQIRTAALRAAMIGALGTVVFASIDRERLAQAMGLKAGQRITLAQSVGFPRR